MRLAEPCRRLELEVYAGSLGSARVAIELVRWGEDHTVVIIDEHPLAGPVPGGTRCCWTRLCGSVT